MGHYVCESTKRYCIVEKIPTVYCSKYLFHVTVFDYIDNREYEGSFVEVANSDLNSEGAVKRFLKCFGLKWQHYASFDAAYKALSNEVKAWC